MSSPVETVTRGRLGQYFGAALLVRVADEGARVALVLLALDRLDDAATGGLLVAALLVPHVLAAPAVGALMDRTTRPRVVIMTAGAAFTLALAVTSAGLGRVPLTLVIATLLAGGCCGPALTGGLTSRLPGLAAEDALPRAFGFDSLTYNAAGILGPALGAAVATLMSPTAAVYALTASAATGTALLTTLRLPAAEIPTGGPSDKPVGGGRAHGWTVLWSDRPLRAVTLASSVGQLGLGALPVAAAVLAVRHHAGGLSGTLLAAFAVGGLLGSLLWTWRPVAGTAASRVVMLSLIATGVPIAFAATDPSAPALIGLFTLAGIGVGPFAGALFTVRQDRAPADVRAQVFTLGAGLKTSCAAGGAALGGALTTWPVSAQLLLAAAFPIAAGSLGLYSRA